MTHYKLLIALGAATTLIACQTTPEPEPIPEPVIVEVEPIQTCIPLSALTRTVIPAKIDVFYGAGEIQDANGGSGSSDATPQRIERIIEPERVVYKDSNGKVVTDICQEDDQGFIPQ